MSQFLGPDLDEITFRMRFDVQYGMNPKQEMDRLLDMSRSGKVEALIIGGIPLGMDKWTVRNVVQKWKTIDGQGRLLSSEASVTLKEYVGR